MNFFHIFISAHQPRENLRPRRSDTGFGTYSVIIYLFNVVMPASCFRNRCRGVLRTMFYFFTVHNTLCGPYIILYLRLGERYG